MGKLCVTTVVNKKYQKYIPMFCFFCSHSYPEYGIKLFLTERLIPAYRKVLNRFKQVQIVENAFQGFPSSNQELKTLRWILDPKDFEGFDSIYVGDIDIIICKEEQGIETQHEYHCLSTGLPYSNGLRRNSRRLSGLHFIKKKPYFRETLETIEKYSRLLKAGKLRGRKNEEVLYNIVTESGLELPPSWFRPHHGLHLGLWRKGVRVLPLEQLDSMGGKKAYSQYLNFFKSIKKTAEFISIQKEFPLDDINYMEQSLID